MSHHEFDERIKSSIDNIASHVHPTNSAWERMEQRLAQEGLTTEQTETNEDSNEVFDQEIREKIEQTTPVFQYRHWLSLSERLEEQEERIAWIYRHKIAEVSLLLLTLFCISNILSIPINTLEALSVPLMLKPQTHSTAKTTTNEEIKTIALHSAIINDTPIYNNSTISNAARTPRFSPRRATMGLLKKIDTKLSFLAIPTIFVRSEKENLTAQLPILRPDIKLQTEQQQGQHSLPYVKPKEKKNYIAFSIVTVADLNTIFTPNDYFWGNEIEAYTSYSIGGGGGFSMSRENNKSAVELGLIYNTKRYQPKGISITSSNYTGVKYKETLSNVQVNMIEFPISYRYKFIKKSKFDYFAGIGGSLNVITQANYDNDRNYFAPVYALRANDEKQPPSEIEEVKKFNAGLLEGGTIQENTYITAHVSLGLEYAITNKISFFHQATYQRHLSLDGIGANNNAFHAYSVWVGLKRKF